MKKTKWFFGGVVPVCLSNFTYLIFLNDYDFKKYLYVHGFKSKKWHAGPSHLLSWLIDSLWTKLRDSAKTNKSWLVDRCVQPLLPTAIPSTDIRDYILAHQEAGHLKFQLQKGKGQKGRSCGWINAPLTLLGKQTHEAIIDAPIYPAKPCMQT